METVYSVRKKTFINNNNKNYIFNYQNRVYNINFTNNNNKFTNNSIAFIKKNINDINTDYKINIKNNEIIVNIECNLSYKNLKTRIIELVKNFFKKNNQHIVFKIDTDDNDTLNIYTVANCLNVIALSEEKSDTKETTNDHEFSDTGSTIVDDEAYNNIESNILKIKNNFIKNIHKNYLKIFNDDTTISEDNINSWIFLAMYNINYKKIIFTVHIKLYEILVKILCKNLNISLIKFDNIETHNLYTLEIDDYIYDFKEYLNICKNCKKYHKIYKDYNYDINNCIFVCSTCNFVSKNKCYKEHVCLKKNIKENCNLCEYYHNVIIKHIPNRGDCYHYINTINTYILQSRFEILKKIKTINKPIKPIDHTNNTNTITYSTVCKLNSVQLDTNSSEIDKYVSDNNKSEIDKSVSDNNKSEIDKSVSDNNKSEIDKKKTKTININFDTPHEFNNTNIYNININFKNKSINLKI